MQRKLTITVDEAIDRSLHDQVGSAHISAFIEELVRSHLFSEDDLEASFRAMAEDEDREREAAERAEALIADASPRA